MKTQVIESVTIAQAHDTVAQAARIYFSRDRQGNYRMDRRRARPLCLMGPAGIGKTEVVRQVAQEEGLAFLSYSITHHTRQSAIGLPRLIEGEIEGKTVSMTEYTMSDIIAQVYRTMEETGPSEGILFLDEFNCASESLRPILLQLLQDKSFGPHRIPDGWMLVLAGNPTEYNRSATELDPVTADRLRLLHISPDYSAWREYAKKKGIHPVILSYLDSHKEHFYLYRQEDSGAALVTARGWEDLSLMLGYLEEENQQPQLSLVAQYIQSGEVARSFFSYWTLYSSIYASEIMELVLSRSPKALSRISRMNFQRRLSLLSALLRRIRTMAEQAVALDETAAALHPLLKELGQAVEAEPPLQEELDMRLMELANRMTDRPGRDFLLGSAIPALAADGGWNAVKESFRTQIVQPREEAFRRVDDAIANTVEVCRKSMEEAQLEFLFHDLCDSPAVARVIVCGNHPEFRELFELCHFDPSSAQELMAALDQFQAS